MSAEKELCTRMKGSCGFRVPAHRDMSIASEMSAVVNRLWRGSKSVSLWLVVVASLPFMIPVLMLLSFFGVIFIVPFGLGMVACILYRTLRGSRSTRRPIKPLRGEPSPSSLPGPGDHIESSQFEVPEVMAKFLEEKRVVEAGTGAQEVSDLGPEEEEETDVSSSDEVTLTTENEDTDEESSPEFESDGEDTDETSSSEVASDGGPHAEGSDTAEVAVAEGSSKSLEAQADHRLTVGEDLSRTGVPSDRKEVDVIHIPDSPAASDYASVATHTFSEVDVTERFGLGSSPQYEENKDEDAREAEAQMDYWRENELSGISSPMGSIGSLSSATDVEMQLRLEIDIIMTIVGHKHTPGRSLWKEVEDLSEIVGIDLPEAGDVSDMDKAMQGLELLKLVIGIK